MRRTILLTTLLLLMSMARLPIPAAADNSLLKLDDAGRELPDSAPNWAMVLDRETGLTWEAKSSDGSLHDKGNLYSWKKIRNTFLKGLNQENFGGYNDWRLPAEHELERLRQLMAGEPTRYEKFFPLTVPATYWTWSRCPDGTLNSVKLKFGSEPAADARQHRIRAVRGELRE